MRTHGRKSRLDRQLRRRFRCGLQLRCREAGVTSGEKVARSRESTPGGWGAEIPKSHHRTGPRSNVVNITVFCGAVAMICGRSWGHIKANYGGKPRKPRGHTENNHPLQIFPT